MSTTTEKKAKTVRIRIAVAVDPQGNWNATGWKVRTGAPPENELMSTALEGLDSSEEACFWVEAELPVPDTRTVKGEVTPA